MRTLIGKIGDGTAETESMSAQIKFLDTNLNPGPLHNLEQGGSREIQSLAEKRLNIYLYELKRRFPDDHLWQMLSSLTRNSDIQ
jgi:hypothetical protein